MIRDGMTLCAAASAFACIRRSILKTSGALAALGGAPNLVRLSAALTATLAGGPTRGAAAPARILYFTLSAGYRHEVIPVSREIMAKIGETAGFDVTFSELDFGRFRRREREHFPCAARYGTEFLYWLGLAGT